ncbi:lysozyme inhibitor LprI family protein [Bacillus sp. 1P02SD]|uniref:lysozyme inhibitor LprI family protein n=1 Tax=Bacillus sp. 1P02SD TaxID=3132264 RepID=UPI0039A27FC5
MKFYRRNLFTILTVVFVILLAACQDSSQESGTKLDKPSQNEQTSQTKKDDTAKTDSTETASNTDNTQTNSTDTSNIDTNEKEDTSNIVTEKEEKPASNTTASFKEEYLKKLNDTKKETDEMEATDTSTFALKKVENDRWEAWDELLNEVYGVLKGQLSSEEMDQLRNEQRNWLKYRDDSALEASLKYKGGTQEHLEYVAVLADLTEVRCYELVEDYM